MTIIYFVLILGITVFIHELGHFLFAKKFGVYVYEFSIGMGPRLFKFNRKNDETDYCIRLFPIGGFVQMAGEQVDVDSNIPEEKRLQSKPAFQRFMIMVAGVMMNFLLSIVLLFVIGLFSKVSTDMVYVKDSVVNGLNDGDKIVAVDNSFVNNDDKLSLEITLTNGKDFNMTVEDINGVKRDISISPIGVGESNLIYGKDFGFDITRSYVENNGINEEVFLINKSQLDSLNKNDRIIAINGESVNDYLVLLDKLNDISISNSSFDMTIDSNGQTKTVNIQITDKPDDKLIGYSYGFRFTGNQEQGFISAIEYSFSKFFSTIEQMIFTVYYLITGKISLSMLSGPIGIYSAVSVYSSYGIIKLISLLCLICINVGFINLLPLPAFDGGHVLFIVIEKIKGSKVDPKVENIIHNIGFILLMILMILVTYNDILRLFK